MIRSTLGPFNPNPKWPEGYVQVLREQGIDENQIPHFLRWVRGFLAQYKGSRRRDLGRREIKPYLSQVAKKPRTYLWGHGGHILIIKYLLSDPFQLTI